MADTLDFASIKEYQPNNLFICSMGHITDRAIHPIWKDLPMTGTAMQYAPLGYIARNGLGEELMYCKYVGADALTTETSPVTISVVESDITSTKPIFSFVDNANTDERSANGFRFYTFAAGNTSPRYGWIRLLFARKRIPL